MCRWTRLRARLSCGGFSLVEVMAALAIMSVALVAVMQLFSSSLNSTRRNEDVTLSLLHARTLLEEACAPGTAPADFSGEVFLESGLEAERSVDIVDTINEMDILDKRAGLDVDDDSEPALYRVTVRVTRPGGGAVQLKCVRAYYENPE